MVEIHKLIGVETEDVCWFFYCSYICIICTVHTPLRRVDLGDRYHKSYRIRG